MMDGKLFTEIFNDSTFNRNVTAMLKRMYLQSKAFFQDDAIDFDDFLQEMWCQLFEEKRFMPDRAWCMEAIKCNALDYIKAIRNNLVGIDVSEYDDGVKEDSDD